MPTFTILPAVDLRGGKCVRLRQGRADDETVYGDDPAAQAAEWARQGAAWLHVVDLDGAFAGRPAHLDVVEKMVAAAKIPVECGGGLRTNADVDALLARGVARAIVGTRALDHEAELIALSRNYGERLAVGIDARDGFVQVKGWTETTRTPAVELAASAAAAGVRTIIYTDTATDGMLRGPNFAGNAELCDAVGPDCRIIASGGISSPGDVRRLRALGRPNLVGAIVGKALYEGLCSLSDLLAAARD